MAVSEELIVRIRGDLRDIQTKLNRLERESGQAANTMARQFQQAGQRMGRAFAALRGPALATGAVAAGIGLISRRSLEATETLQDLADRANVSAQFLQELRFVTNQSGASARDFDDAISRLNRRLGLFQQNLATGEGEAGPAAAAFRALGLEADIASGNLADTEQVFAAVISSLQEVQNESQKAALASQLFGEDAGPRLVGLINRGPEGIRELSQEMRNLGIVMSNEVVAAAAATSDELEVLDTIVDARLNETVARNADGLRTWAEGWANIRVAIIDVVGALGEFFSMSSEERWENNRRQIELYSDAVFAFYRIAPGLAAGLATATSNANEEIERTTTNVEEALNRFESFGLDADDLMNLAAGDIAATVPTPEGDGQQDPAKDIDALRESITTATAAAVGFGDELKEVEEAGEEVRRKTSEIAEEIDRTPGFTRMIESAMTLEDALVSSIKAFEDTLVDAITEGKLEFDDLARHILRTFARMAVQQYITGPIARFASAVFGAGPGKATGGPASGLTLVGEQGPELVNLGPMANVMTANMTKAVMQGDMRRGGSGGPVSINNSYTIDARGADAGAESRIRQAIQEASAVSAAQAEARTLRAITSAQRNRRAY